LIVVGLVLSPTMLNLAACFILASAAVWLFFLILRTIWEQKCKGEEADFLQFSCNTHRPNTGPDHWASSSIRGLSLATILIGGVFFV